VLAYPRVAIWVAGLVAIGAGAAMRARRLGEARDYAPRPDPISGWSWGAVLGVVVLFLLVLIHRGPEDDFRFVAGVLALGSFAARSIMARRQGIRLMADLHSAETRYRSLVEQIPLAIYTTGLDTTGSAKYMWASGMRCAPATPGSRSSASSPRTAAYAGFATER
jgi:hypothetical protein